MPNYILRNKDTDEINEYFFKIVDLQSFLKENPNIEIYYGPRFGIEENKKAKVEKIIISPKGKDI